MNAYLILGSSLLYMPPYIAANRFLTWKKLEYKVDVNAKTHMEKSMNKANLIKLEIGIALINFVEKLTIF